MPSATAGSARLSLHGDLRVRTRAGCDRRGGAPGAPRAARARRRGARRLAPGAAAGVPSRPGRVRAAARRVAAAAAGKRLDEHTAPFVQAFFEDRDYLRIQPAHAYPRATASVPAMVRLVERLLERGVAYKGEDGSIYFAIAKFATYGRLSRLDTRELKLGARVATDEYAKDDPRDFALWKKAEPADERVGAAWDAPFGRGRPGWHPQ